MFGNCSLEFFLQYRLLKVYREYKVNKVYNYLGVLHQSELDDYLYCNTLVSANFSASLNVLQSLYGCPTIVNPFTADINSKKTN